MSMSSPSTNNKQTDRQTDRQTDTDSPSVSIQSDRQTEILTTTPRFVQHGCQPEKTADVSRGRHLSPRKTTSE